MTDPCRWGCPRLGFHWCPGQHIPATPGGITPRLLQLERENAELRAMVAVGAGRPTQNHKTNAWVTCYSCRMASTDDVILEETRRFHASLPALMPKYAHRWVVYKAGDVASAHPTEQAAYEAALAQFGVKGGFIVAQVESVQPTPITAGVMFGHA